VRAFSFLQRGVAQIGIVIEDLDASVGEYAQRYAVGPWHIYTYGRPLVRHMTYRGQAADYVMRVGVANAGPTRIELIQPVRGPSVYEEFVTAHGFGAHHLGILVDDMAAALAEAGECGIEMTMDGAGFGLGGDGHYAYLDTESLLGVTLELIQRPARRVPPERIVP